MHEVSLEAALAATQQPWAQQRFHNTCFCSLLHCFCLVASTLFGLLLRNLPYHLLCWWHQDYRTLSCVCLLAQVPKEVLFIGHCSNLGKMSFSKRYFTELVFRKRYFTFYRFENAIRVIYRSENAITPTTVSETLFPDLPFRKRYFQTYRFENASGTNLR